MDKDEEDVEILLTFEHWGKEFNLVRLIDLVLMIRNNTEGKDLICILLLLEEADETMTVLAEMFLGYQD